MERCGYRGLTFPHVVPVTFVRVLLSQSCVGMSWQQLVWTSVRVLLSQGLYGCVLATDGVSVSDFVTRVGDTSLKEG